MMQRASSRKGSLGFTLIEVLIAISVVAALTVLIIIGSKAAVEQSKRVGCITKLRAFGVAVAAYAAEHRGHWPYYILEQPDGRPPNDTFTTSAARNYGIWLGPGVLYRYLDGKEAYICPADKSGTENYQQYDWDTYTGNLWGTYQMRGFRQTYKPEAGRPSSNPLGSLLSDVSTRSIMSCHFSCIPTNLKRYPLSHHGASYPVLYGNGSVQSKPMPSFIEPNAPPDIWNTTSYQIHYWDSFDDY